MGEKHVRECGPIFMGETYFRECCPFFMSEQYVREFLSQTLWVKHIFRNLIRIFMGEK